MILIALIFFSFYFNKPIVSDKTIFIPKGSTFSIISHLNKKGFDVNFFDVFILKIIGEPQSGWIDLKQTHITKLDFLYKLTSSKAAMKSLLLVPGETYFFFLHNVAKELNLSHDKLLKNYKKYSKREDGNILAETYNLPVGMNEEKTIKYMIGYTDKKYKDLSQKIFGDYDEKKWFSYITVASIIQKEAANNKEMAIVASVIYNRLAKRMPLQMDGTLNYGKFSHTKVTPQMIDNDTSSYNTYKKYGLPKNPVCAVSLDAIKAAIFPAQTPYIYFVKSGQNNHHTFSVDFDQHKKNIKSNVKIEPKSSEKFSTKKIDIKEIWEQ